MSPDPKPAAHPPFSSVRLVIHFDKENGMDATAAMSPEMAERLSEVFWSGVAAGHRDRPCKTCGKTIYWTPIMPPFWFHVIDDTVPKDSHEATL